MPCDPRRPPGGGGGLSALRFGVRALFRDGDAGAIVFFSPFARPLPPLFVPSALLFRGARRNPTSTPRFVSETFCSSPSSYTTECFPVCASNASTTP